MLRLRHVALATVLACLITSVTSAQSFSSQTTALLTEFGASVVLADEDNDGQITDQDFIIFLLDRIFEGGLEDQNCDNVIDEVDAVLGLARELTSLGADFDNSGVVSSADIAHVTLNLGQQLGLARKGDVNGDALVDAIDLFDACDRLGKTVSLDPVTVAYEILQPFLSLEPWMQSISLPVNEPCPTPEPCGSATCRIKCVDAFGGSWTYRLFMVGFCGSQFEATECCELVKVIACNCSPDGFSLQCWAEAQGAYVTCLVVAPG